MSAARNEVALNESAERLTVVAELARRYPNARIVFSGGSGALLLDEGNEAESRRCGCWKASGLRRARILLDDRSRNTVENALFSKAIAQPKAGERWLLVTSAYHMPRSVGVFRKAGFPVEAFPVDWRTRGRADLATVAQFQTPRCGMGGAGVLAHRQHREPALDRRSAAPPAISGCVTEADVVVIRRKRVKLQRCFSSAAAASASIGP